MVSRACGRETVTGKSRSSEIEVKRRFEKGEGRAEGERQGHSTRCPVVQWLERRQCGSQCPAASTADPSPRYPTTPSRFSIDASPLSRSISHGPMSSNKAAEILRKKAVHGSFFLRER